jgi:hypothetical protein
MHPPPKRLSKEEKALPEATRAAMKALDERIKKHGYPPDLGSVDIRNDIFLYRS